MKIVRLSTEGFRNLVPAVHELDAPLVVWWGPNGMGKTNLLEAVGVLGSLRSLRTTRLADLVQAGGDRVAVTAVADSEGCVRRFSWSHGSAGRRLEREERPVDALTWLTSLRATWFAPEDVHLVRGEPAARRALLDRTVLTVDPDYLVPARALRRVLDHKSALLRSGRASAAELDVLDDQLAKYGADVSSRRLVVVARLREAWGSLYQAIAATERSGVKLRSWLGEGDAAELEARYRARLDEQRPAERDARRNLGGPQRDDLEFRVGGLSARTTSSQGQARSLVLTWKLAELEVARSRHGEAPLFLMDDLGSELDPARTTALMELLRSLGAQVFVTTTDRRYIPAGHSDALSFEVREGAATAS